MTSLSELTDFYYKDLFPILKNLDEQRKHLRYRLIVIGVIYTLVSVLIFSSLFSYINGDGFVFFIIIYVAIASFIYKFLTKDYVKEFKSKIIQPLIYAVDRNLHYSSELHLSERTFNNSLLFSSPDRISGNDYVRGLVNGIKLEFSDIHAEKKHRDSKGRSHWKTIFQGLFIVAEFNKNFIGTTVILPDVAQSTFGDLIGNFLQSLNFTRKDLVKMDDPEFEKEFVVYASDQIEARYILSHSLMKKLLTYVKKTKEKVYISFVGKDIHMAIDYKKDMFEPSVFKSLLEYKTAMEYVATLHLAIGIVEELKLNQKIWSKK